ncbi:MAG: thiamine phosphate synthase [Deltaproteobacteria bacterium]|nr:thiamine phosphate synthase [Deltaproteobacteria bacterium]
MSADTPEAPDRALAVRGLYPLLSEGVVPVAHMPQAARVLADAGCTALQLRLKTWNDGARLRIQREVAAALAGSDVTLVIDDRADLAAILAAEAPPGVAVGLHLGQRDLPPAAARAIVGPGPLMGWSTHDEAQLARASELPVDYLGYGPVYATFSKEGADPTVGIEGLRRAVARSRLPVVAIGGLDLQTAPLAMEAGAAAVAVIAALFDGLDLADAAGLGALAKRARALQDALA